MVLRVIYLVVKGCAFILRFVTPWEVQIQLGDEAFKTSNHTDEFEKLLAAWFYNNGATKFFTSCKLYVLC